MLIKRQIPIRFGVVLLPTEGDVDSTTISRLFYHLVDTYGRAVAMKFAEDLLESYDPATLSAKMKSLYSTIYSKSSSLPGHEKIPYDDLVASVDSIAEYSCLGRRLGVNPKDGAIFGNGQVFLKDDTWINKLGGALHEDVFFFKKQSTLLTSPTKTIFSITFSVTPRKVEMSTLFPATIWRCQVYQSSRDFE